MKEVDNNQAISEVVARHSHDMNTTLGIMRDQSFQDVIFNPEARKEFLKPENQEAVVQAAQVGIRAASQRVGAGTFVLTALPGAFMASGFIKKFKNCLPEKEFFTRLTATAKANPVAASFFVLPFIAAPLAARQTHRFSGKMMEQSLVEAKRLAIDLENGNAQDASSLPQTESRVWSQDERNQQGYKSAAVAKSI